MSRFTAVVKHGWLLALASATLVLAACSEGHPDDQPGAVNNPYPDVSISESSTVTFEPDDSAMTHQVRVSFSRSAPTDGRLEFRVVEGSATLGRDVEVIETSQAFSEGQRHVNLPVRVLNDPQRFNDREFRIEITRAHHAILTEQTVHQVTITANEAPTEDDASAPIATLNLPSEINWTAPLSGTEYFSVVIPLSQSTQEDASVEVRLNNGSARRGEDFEGISSDHCDNGTCTISAGRTELDFFVPIRGQFGGDDRTFSIQFLNAQGIDLPDQREVEVNLSYQDSSEVSQLQIPANIALRMPSASRQRTTYPIVFTLSSPLQRAGSLSLRTVNDSALEGVHFTGIDATGDDAVNVSAGQHEVSVDVELLHDPALEENAEFTIQLVSGEGIALGEMRDITIDVINTNISTQAPVEPTVILPSSLTYHEPPSDREYQLLVPLSETIPVDGRVRVSLIEQTARDGVDFEAYADVIDIPQFATEILVPVTLLNNPASTEEQSFRVELSQPQGVTLGEERSFEVTIVDRFSAAPDPQLQLSPSLVRVPTPLNTMDPQNVTLYFELSDAAEAGSSVFVRSRNGSAASGIDFDEVGERIALAEGATWVEVEVTLLPTTSNDAREFELVFSDATGLSLPESRAVTVQIDPRNTPAIPRMNVPSEPVVLVAPAGSNRSLRTIVLPFDAFAPLRGRVQIRANDQSAVEGRNFSFVERNIAFNIGARELVIEVFVEQAGNNRSFELVIESGRNVQLPDLPEQRIVPVVILGN